MIPIRIQIAIAVACVLAACSGDLRRGVADQVPAAWSSVREADGHRLHVGEKHLACRECHGDDFTRPAIDVCEKCHTARPTLHGVDPILGLRGPACQECHAFAGASRTCMSCHDEPQGAHAAVGAHAGEKCSACHRAHGTPSLVPAECTTCHADRTTGHGGLRGCRDCHGVHEAGTQPAALDDTARPAANRPDHTCAACHAKQRPRVDERALVPGAHPQCTTCHPPHTFAKQGMACTTAGCHANKPVLGPQKHATCLTCHQQHEGAAAKACTTCHANQPIAHPMASGRGTAVSRPEATDVATTGRASPACRGCHPPHTGAKATTCESCHANQRRHATAACRDCHDPHAKSSSPGGGRAACNRCHVEKVTSTASTGHATCTSCHAKIHAPQRPPACQSCHTAVANVVKPGHAACANCHRGGPHAPRLAPPACATCHAAQHTTAPKGHATCTSCHQPHGARQPGATTCASCHADRRVGHGARQKCETCHRAHGPGGVPRPPSCTTCHAKRPGLHASKGHTTCASCHLAHEATPRDDRATCITCHPAQQNHEPAAQRCKGCHPFAPNRGT